VNRVMLRSPGFKRLVACLAGSLVLAVMIGPQEGTQADYGYAFRQAVFKPRVFVFLGIGVLMFLLVTYWPRVTPYFTRPGAVALCTGLTTVIAAQFLLRWDDQVGNAKFGAVSRAVSNTSGLSPATTAFFSWLHWVQFLVIAVLAAFAVAQRNRMLAWVTAAFAVVAGGIAFYAHNDVISFSHVADHSFGAFTTLLGYLVVAVGCSAAALSHEQATHARDSIDRVLAWRPGLPIAAVGAAATIIAMTTSAWFSPLRLNASFSSTHDLFAGYGLSPISSQYLAWLGWVLLAVVAITALSSTYLRLRLGGWIAAGLSVVAVLLTVVTLYDISKIGADNNVDAATGP
jgi:hypothetical protein